MLTSGGVGLVTGPMSVTAFSRPVVLRSDASAFIDPLWYSL